MVIRSEILQKAATPPKLRNNGKRLEVYKCGGSEPPRDKIQTCENKGLLLGGAVGVSKPRRFAPLG